jgi:hypothetical protein
MMSNNTSLSQLPGAGCTKELESSTTCRRDGIPRQTRGHTEAP